MAETTNANSTNAINSESGGELAHNARVMQEIQTLAKRKQGIRPIPQGTENAPDGATQPHRWPWLKAGQ